MEPTRRPRRLVFAAIVASLTVLCGSFALVQSRADATWRAFLRKAGALRARVHGQPDQRDPLHGTGTEQSAFVHYAEAAALAHQLTDAAEIAWGELVNGDDAHLREATAALRARWQPALAALAAGARARDVQRDAAPDAPNAILDLLDHRSLCNFAAFEARLACQEGDGERAVHVALDAATLGMDLVGDGLLIHQMIGAAMLAITVKAWSDDALRSLEPEALAEFARGLEALDGRLPMRLRLDREHLFVAESLRRVPEVGTDWGDVQLATWRYGFSTRWLCADAFLLTTNALEAAAGSQATAWSDRKREYERAGRELSTTGNPVARLMVPNLTAAEQCLRGVVAEVRMLRMAVDEHRGLVATPLDDPLGDGPLACERSESTIRWHSVGGTAAAPLERTARR